MVSICSRLPFSVMSHKITASSNEIALMDISLVTVVSRDPSRNFKKINPTKSKIRLIFGLAVFCREFECSAKLRLTETFPAKIQIIITLKQT